MTTTTKHTAGPWTLEAPPVCADRHRYVCSETETIAEIRTTSEGVFVDSANARLIAAAPELLAALEPMLLWLETPQSAEAQGIVWRDLLAPARAAIAKAAGEA